MKILCSGDRHWDSKKKIKQTLRLFTLTKGSLESTVVHGGSGKADLMSGKVAFELGFRCKVYKAKWTKYGKAAGPIRNQEMLDEEKPDCLIAFHSNIKKSRGTKDMIKRAIKAGIPVLRVE